jgi:phosphatidylserine decarboxylase
MQLLKDWLVSPEIAEIRKMSMADILKKGFHRESLVPIFINKEVLFSPANGVILYVKHIKNREEIINVHGTPLKIKDLIRTDLYDDEFIVIGIFMTMYDEHINFMPSSGYLSFKDLPKLKIDNMTMTSVELALIEANDHPDTEGMEYLFYNERMLNTVFDNEIGQEYYIVQIADADVGAIIPFKENDKFIAQGYPFSAVRFGSQVDLIIPLKPRRNYEVLVGDKIGWHVSAVADPLVKITKSDASSIPVVNMGLPKS